MKETSLNPIFMPATSDIAAEMELAHGDINQIDLRHTVQNLPFNKTFDIFRTAAWEHTQQGQAQAAIDHVLHFDSLATRLPQQSRQTLDIHAALMQILTAIYLQADMYAEAAQSAAATLTLLSQEPRRKDEPFLEILAALLYDIALFHNEREENKQAERAIEKSLKLFERLARTNPDRYGPPHLMAVNASTEINKSTAKQTKTLAEFQAAANEYMRLMGEGVEDAGMRLTETIIAEGRTLVKMNRHREAIQYFTRAMKNLSRISPEFSRLHLELSIDLGSALLTQKGTREKGIHLLNTMLYKANKIEADDLHRRIVDILLETKDPNLGIFGFWHKLFPR